MCYSSDFVLSSVYEEEKQCHQHDSSENERQIADLEVLLLSELFTLQVLHPRSKVSHLVLVQRSHVETRDIMRASHFVDEVFPGFNAILLSLCRILVNNCRNERENVKP